VASLDMDKVATYFHETGDAFAGNLVMLGHNVERHGNGDAPLDPSCGVPGAAYAQETKDAKSNATSGDGK
jgi:hypothetical protein